MWKVVILSFLDYTTYMLQSIPSSSDYNQPQHLLLLLSVGTLTTDTNDLNSRKNILCGRKDIQRKIEKIPHLRIFDHFQSINHQQNISFMKRLLCFFMLAFFASMSVMIRGNTLCCLSQVVCKDQLALEHTERTWLCCNICADPHDLTLSLP